MNKEEFIKILGDGPEAVTFGNYCIRLKNETDKAGKLKNPWMQKKSIENLCELYRKVERDGMYIDGVHVTIQSTGVSYDYIAFKNKMYNVYPESVIDCQLVRDGDEFDFSKESGKVVYTHKISNPFEKKDIIGAYCIIKNKRGEFITILTKEDIDKHRKVAKTDYIWRQWFDEMALKTVVKKACKLHFADVYQNIEEVDNENYDLEKLVITPKKVTDEQFRQILTNTNEWIENHYKDFEFTTEQEKVLAERLDSHA